MGVQLDSFKTPKLHKAQSTFCIFSSETGHNFFFFFKILNLALYLINYLHNLKATSTPSVVLGVNEIKELISNLLSCVINEIL